MVPALLTAVFGGLLWASASAHGPPPPPFFGGPPPPPPGGRHHHHKHGHHADFAALKAGAQALEEGQNVTAFAHVVGSLPLHVEFLLRLEKDGDEGEARLLIGEEDPEELVVGNRTWTASTKATASGMVTHLPFRPPLILIPSSPPNTTNSTVPPDTFCTLEEKEKDEMPFESIPIELEILPFEPPPPPPHRRPPPPPSDGEGEGKWKLDQLEGSPVSHLTSEKEQQEGDRRWMAQSATGRRWQRPFLRADGEGRPGHGPPHRKPFWEEEEDVEHFVLAISLPTAPTPKPPMPLLILTVPSSDSTSPSTSSIRVRPHPPPRKPHHHHHHRGPPPPLMGFGGWLPGWERVRGWMRFDREREGDDGTREMPKMPLHGFHKHPLGPPREGGMPPPPPFGPPPPIHGERPPPPPPHMFGGHHHHHHHHHGPPSGFFGWLGHYMRVIRWKVTEMCYRVMGKQMPRPRHGRKREGRERRIVMEGMGCRDREKAGVIEGVMQAFREEERREWERREEERERMREDEEWMMHPPDFDPTLPPLDLPFDFPSPHAMHAFESSLSHQPDDYLSTFHVQAIYYQPAPPRHHALSPYLLILPLGLLLGGKMERARRRELENARDRWNTEEEARSRGRWWTGGAGSNEKDGVIRL